MNKVKIVSYLYLKITFILTLCRYTIYSSIRRKVTTSILIEIVVIISKSRIQKQSSIYVKYPNKIKLK